MILLCSYDKNKKEKNIKWYIDKILIAYTIQQERGMRLPISKKIALKVK